MILTVDAFAQNQLPHLWRPDYGNKWRESTPRDSRQSRQNPEAQEPIEVAPPPEKPEIPGTPHFTQDQFIAPKEKKKDYRHPYVDDLRDVPDKDREWSEVEIAKGIIAFNEALYQESPEKIKTALKKAKDLLEKALSYDPRNFLAAEYLAAVEERNGDLHQALTWIIRAKHLSPKAHWGALNFHSGRLYFLLANEERAEIYLTLALEEGGHAAHAHYLLGFMRYSKGEFLEAISHFQSAKMIALKKINRRSDPRLGENGTDRIDPNLDENPDRFLLQVIYYYLGEIYARYGYLRYAVSNLQSAEYGESLEIRNAAWKLHSEINHSIFNFTLGEFVQYDSNVALLALDSDLPSQFSYADSFKNVLIARTGWQTSPSPRWSGGADFNYYWNYHFERTLHDFDVMDFDGDVWANYWNRKDWSLEARYQGNLGFVDRNNFFKYQMVHGPMLSGSYFPFQRWNFEGGFQFRQNKFFRESFDGPDRRTGYSYFSYIRTSLRALEASFRPGFGYSFEANVSSGVNFRSYTHTGTSELVFLPTTKTNLIAGFNFSRSIFPLHRNGRSDSIFEFRGAVNQWLGNHFMVSLDFGDVFAISTLRAFNYNRFVFTSGLSYTY